MPYNKAQPRYHVFYDPIRVAKSGYAVVWQDCRGTMASHGEYYSFMKEKGGSEHARKYLKFIIGPWFHFADLTQQVGELDFGLG